MCVFLYGLFCSTILFVQCAKYGLVSGVQKGVYLDSGLFVIVFCELPTTKAMGLASGVKAEIEVL